jgi:hypothetical protein
MTRIVEDDQVGNYSEIDVPNVYSGIGLWIQDGFQVEVSGRFRIFNGMWRSIVNFFIPNDTLTYITDEYGNLLTDPDGNLIVLG